MRLKQAHPFKVLFQLKSLLPVSSNSHACIQTQNIENLGVIRRGGGEWVSKDVLKAAETFGQELLRPVLFSSGQIKILEKLFYTSRKIKFSDEDPFIRIRLRPSF